MTLSEFCCQMYTSAIKLELATSLTSCTIYSNTNRFLFTSANTELIFFFSFLVSAVPCPLWAITVNMTTSVMNNTQSVPLASCDLSTGLPIFAS